MQDHSRRRQDGQEQYGTRANFQPSETDDGHSRQGQYQYGDPRRDVKALGKTEPLPQEGMQRTKRKWLLAPIGANKPKDIDNALRN